MRSVNNSVDYKTSENSIKSKQKNQKYLASINSGSKTTTTEKMNLNFQTAPQQPIPTAINAYHTLNAATSQSVQRVSNSSLDSSSGANYQSNKIGKNLTQSKLKDSQQS